MKKIFLLVITIFASFLLVACNGDGDTEVYQILIPEQETLVRKDADFDPLDGVRLVDSKGATSDKYEIKVDGTLDLSKEGTYTITYKLEEEVEFTPVTRTIDVQAVAMNGVADTKITAGDANFNLLTGVIVIDPILGTLYANQEPDQEYFTFKVDDGPVSNFNIHKLGDYKVTYIFAVDNFVLEVDRTIKVVNEATILGIDDTEVLVKSGLFDPTYRVTIKNPTLDDDNEYVVEDIDPSYLEVEGWDEFDPDVLGEYILVYKIKNPENELEYLKDADGEDIAIERKVTVYNEVKLFGTASKSVTIGTEDFDPMSGVRALDALDGDITDQVVVTGAEDINFNKLGEYTIVYSVEGAGNVVVEVTVKITIVEELTGKQVITIMAGDLREVNPFHPNYSGANQAERQAIQRAVEAEYNVEISYEPYPDNAAWGPARVNAMIEAAVAGHHLSDFYYHITTDWLRDLVQGGALAPIDKYRDNVGAPLHETFYNAGEYNGQHYTFSPGALTLDRGLFFNLDLLESLDIPNPADLYNQGNWTWNGFAQWAEAADSKIKSMGDDYYTLGGVLSYYAENMVPLNGGQFVDFDNERIAFTDQPALDTYQFIRSLYERNYFEPTPSFDAGSDEWKSGKVLMHPGDLWFINADNRWGDLNYGLGYVPYPMNDDYIAAGGEFISPIFGVSIVVMSSGMTPEREELAFKVWMALQQWEAEEELKESYENSLRRSFDDVKYIDIMLENFDRTYNERLNSMGISSYGTGTFRVEVTNGIRTGDYDTRLAGIMPTYQFTLLKYLRGD